MIPIDNIAELIPYQNMLTAGQINKLGEGIRFGSPLF